ncbi:haloacid dehalogenase-like hydrolase [Amycolatopsis cynarae]|uniref:Haloacid dehalogenase-like hydrolase n=1 Tax=Amycolatopsis cynarae TaxID=2995223 RepID=A0ABY7B1W7_9PSEU|nr:haloacid dehalogenase-like hydrolase [Amycolatopsis sp. HUAS 11-8]WAL66295.1 haloacid dehalogenase-like hydrolase [Amycolatopsis sp. HUAS 11-8]
MGITVGFDLDMTLIDPRPGMTAVLNALGEESGLALDGEHFAANLGPPLDQVLLASGAPAPRVPELVARFRELYPEIVIPSTVALPGAHAALAAVHAAGGRTVVVTGKYGPNAALHVKALGFEVDVLVGELWADGKAVALREHGAAVYAGDHLGDVRGALAAGAIPVGVTTGPCTREELAAAGAEVIFDSLEEFPGWLSLSGARGSGR